MSAIKNLSNFETLHAVFAYESVHQTCNTFYVPFNAWPYITFRSLILIGPRRIVWFLATEPHAASSTAQVSQTDFEWWRSRMMATAGLLLIDIQPLINTLSATTVLQKVTLQETQNWISNNRPTCYLQYIMFWQTIFLVQCPLASAYFFSSNKEGNK